VAGKNVKFYVTVKKVLRPTIPEIKVEDFRELTKENFADMNGVRDYVRNFLESRAKSNAYSHLAVYLQRNLLEKSTIISYPERELEHYRNQFIAYYTQNAQDGITLEEFCRTQLSMSYEEFNEYAVNFAKESVKATLMVKIIARKENVVCTDEQLKSVIVQMYRENMSRYGSMESFLVAYGDIYSVDYFEDQVIGAAVSELLTQKAVKIGDL
jgi:FKBP-type peptidyl-prolyl cis-trans isomerase (trigger factor)